MREPQGSCGAPIGEDSNGSKSSDLLSLLSCLDTGIRKRKTKNSTLSSRDDFTSSRPPSIPKSQRNIVLACLSQWVCCIWWCKLDLDFGIWNIQFSLVRTGHLHCNELANEESKLESLYLCGRNVVHLARPMVCEVVKLSTKMSYFTIKWDAQFHDKT